jgi:hypothetical protein
MQFRSDGSPSPSIRRSLRKVCAWKNCSGDTISIWQPPVVVWSRKLGDWGYPMEIGI